MRDSKPVSVSARGEHNPNLIPNSPTGALFAGGRVGATEGGAGDTLPRGNAGGTIRMERMSIHAASTAVGGTVQDTGTVVVHGDTVSDGMSNMGDSDVGGGVGVGRTAARWASQASPTLARLLVPALQDLAAQRPESTAYVPTSHPASRGLTAPVPLRARAHEATHPHPTPLVGGYFFDVSLEPTSYYVLFYLSITSWRVLVARRGVCSPSAGSTKLTEGTCGGWRCVCMCMCIVQRV